MKRSLTISVMSLGLFLAWQGSGGEWTEAKQPLNSTSLDPNAASSLVADYQFRDSLNSSVSNAPALTDLGSNSFESSAVDDSSRRVLQFDPNNGVALTPTTGLISNQSYTIVILFSFSTTGGYRRILDFKNGTSDFGLYMQGDNFSSSKDGPVVFKRGPNQGFFVRGTNPVFHANAVTQLAITRDTEGNVGVYVNGLRQISFIDSDGDAVINASNTLRFFRDNVGDGESSAGVVARIRLFNTVLSGTDIAGLDRLANTQAGCPSVSGLSPNNGQPGTTFAITGTGLSGVTSVSFPNGVAAPFTINNDTQLTVTVPSGAITGTLTLSKNSCNPVQTAAVFSISTNTPSALVADYQFQNSLQSTAGYPPALLSLGNNAFETITIDNRFRRALKFEPNNGVALFSTAGLISSQAYTAAMLVSFSSISGNRRILDFKNGTSDSGLYLSGFQTDANVLFKNSRSQILVGRDRSVIQPNEMVTV